MSDIDGLYSSRYAFQMISEMLGCILVEYGTEEHTKAIWDFQLRGHGFD